MSDALLVWKDYGADIAIGDFGDLVMDQGLETAVLISLFTDARAPDDAVLPAGTSRRGWWNDSTDDVAGSLLWLLERQKTLPEVAEQVREFCAMALEWMIRDEITSRIDVEPVLVRPFAIQLSITFHRGASRQYEYLWDGTLVGKRVVINGTTIQLQFI